MAHHRRRRKPHVGCCGMCTLRKTDGTRKRRPTNAEIRATIGEREQRDGYTGSLCGEGWCCACDTCYASGIDGDVCSVPGCPDCGGPPDEAPVESLPRIGTNVGDAIVASLAA